MEPINGSIDNIENIDLNERIGTVLILNFFSFFGILVSIIPLFLTYSTELKNSLVNIMVSNLSAADFLLCCLFIANTPYVLYRETLSPNGCQWLGFFIFTLAFEEGMFPGFISLNRYIAFYHPSSYRKIFTPKTAIFLIALTWVLSAIVPYLFFRYGLTGFDEDNEHCCFFLPARTRKWAILFWLGIFFPTMVCGYGTMCFCNYRLYKKLADHASTERLGVNVVQRNRELLYFLWIDVIFPFLAFGSYQIVKFFVYERFSVHFRRFMAVVYLSHAVVRGMLTLIMLRPYRSAFIRAIGFCRKKNSNSEGFSGARYSAPEDDNLELKNGTVSIS